MPSPLAEAFLMGILNGCYETPSKCEIVAWALTEEELIQQRVRLFSGTATARERGRPRLLPCDFAFVEHFDNLGSNLFVNIRFHIDMD